VREREGGGEDRERAHARACVCAGGEGALDVRSHPKCMDEKGHWFESFGRERAKSIETACDPARMTSLRTMPRTML
jgi:hypothetical protein